MAAAALALGAAARAVHASEEPAVPFRVVFFPPETPAYGARIPERPAETRLRFAGRPLSPPEGLAEFVGDTIYPALSTRLYGGGLNRSLDKRVEAYRVRRNALVHALLDEFLMVHDAADEERERRLRAFAATQTPAIVELEAEADALRRDLTRSPLGLDISWNASRRWKLGSFPASRDWMNLEAEFQVVRAAAFYDDGFIPAQRGLLRELALELDRQARKARGERVDRTESDAMFFSPETVRLRLPPSLTPDVLARVATYNGRKAALKEQLRQAVRSQENASRTERAAAFARLADEQWPQLGELEELAETLRGDLAAHFVPAPPLKAPAIPGWLIKAIESYNEDRDTYFGELQQRRYEAMADIPQPPRSADSDEQLRSEDEYARRRKEVEREVLREFQKETAERFAMLASRYEAIRTALESIAKTTADPKTGRPLNVESLLREHTATMAEFDRFGRTSSIYRNYRTAALQRGLSPEQRRLLFSYAVAGLAQPLPHGEPLPRGNFKFPLPR